MSYKTVLPLLVLAGGEGTRLKKIGNSDLKIFTPIGNRLFIEEYLDNLKRLGFKEIIFLIHEESELTTKKFQEYLNSYDFKFSFLFDGKKRMGTGGAIINNLDNLPDIFWIMYGDTLLNFNVLEAQKAFFESKKDSLMTIIPKNLVEEKANIEFKNNEIINYSKKSSVQKNYVDYGGLIFKKSAFYNLDNEYVDLDKIIKRLIDKKSVYHLKVLKRFYEMGNIKSYKTLDNLLKHKKLEQLWDE